MKCLRLCCLLVVVVSVRPLAQAPRPQFESVSITRVAPNLLSTFRDPDRVGPTRSFSAIGTIEDFVSFAYNVDTTKVAGAPEWARVEKFSITAEAAEAVAVERMRLMVQSLLEDRFKLIIRKSGQGGGIVIPGLYVIDSVQQAQN